MNVIIFIISVFKLLFMHGKYILIILVLILFFTLPVSGSLTKIALGSPVYIGESDLDISSALLDCHTIDWWANGSDMTKPPAKNISISKPGADSPQVFHYNISPDIFTGYTGNWYCEEKKPLRVVFEVLEPQLTIRAWDLDTNQDATGKTLPMSTNISYRIDTNLNPALQYLERPNVNPLDSFYTVKLTDPLGRGISNVFTGSAGGASTQIVSFDSKPYITASPYFWNNAKIWNHESRNAVGEKLYPDGMYTFTVSQNLNKMQEAFATNGIRNLDGITTASASVSLIRVQSATTSSATTATTSLTTQIPASATLTPVFTGTENVLPVTTPPSPGTTYSPLPAGIALAGLLIAGLVLINKRG